MKAILYITALFLLTSCSVFRKTKQTEVHKTEETEVVKQDSLVVSKKDSTYTKEESSQNENTIEIEFDSSGGIFGPIQYMKPLSGLDLVKNGIVNVGDPTYREPIKAADYFPQITGKIHKITIRNSQTVSKKDSVRVVDESLAKHSRIDSSSLTKNDKSEVVKSSRCSLPLWNIIVIGGIVLFLIWAYRKYKSFII